MFSIKCTGSALFNLLPRLRYNVRLRTHAHKCPTCAHLILYVCDHDVFSINCTTVRLDGAAVIFAFGAGLPKVIGPRKGHAGKQYIFA